MSSLMRTRCWVKQSFIPVSKPSCMKTTWSRSLESIARKSMKPTMLNWRVIYVIETQNMIQSNGLPITGTPRLRLLLTWGLNQASVQMLARRWNTMKCYTTMSERWRTSSRQRLRTETSNWDDLFRRAQWPSATVLTNMLSNISKLRLRSHRLGPKIFLKKWMNVCTQTSDWRTNWPRFRGKGRRPPSDPRSLSLGLSLKANVSTS